MASTSPPHSGGRSYPAGPAGPGLSWGPAGSRSTACDQPGPARPHLYKARKLNSVRSTRRRARDLCAKHWELARGLQCHVQVTEPLFWVTVAESPARRPPTVTPGPARVPGPEPLHSGWPRQLESHVIDHHRWHLSPMIDAKPNLSPMIDAKPIWGNFELPRPLRGTGSLSH